MGENTGGIKLKASAIQMVSTLDWQENFNTAAILLQQAAQQQSSIAVLPENFITYGDKATPSEQQQHQFLTDFSVLAKSLGVWIVAGTFPLQNQILATKFPAYQHVKHDVRPYAASMVFNPNGEAVAVYTKLHLFDVDVKDNVQRYCESQIFRPGESPTVFDVFQQACGLAVCYDLRFPELFRVYSDNECKLICFPSAFTAKTGEAHWRTLVCARAIETQSYIVAANQGGEHPNSRHTWGESMIVDPWGNVLACQPKGDGVITAEIDFAFVDRCRKAMPVQQHRRL